MSALYVHAINLKAKLAVLSDGRMVPITKMFNAYGQQVVKWRKATRIVCGIDGVGWFTDYVASFDKKGMN